jgi:Class III cytochrome C family
MTSRAAEKNLRYRAAGLAAFVVLAALGFTLPRQPSSAASVLVAVPEPQRRAQPVRAGGARAAKRGPRTDYRKFSHGSAKHREQACDSCHKFPSPEWQSARKGDAAFPDVIQQPQHASCLNCHRQQFFARERPAPAICSVCHVNSTPRSQPRHPFPNPPEVFNATARARNFVSDFQIFFPHDKHVEVVSALRPAHEAQAGASFLPASFPPRASAQQKEAQKQGEQKPNETSCAVCHQTYGPQGETEEEYATKPPQDLGEAFWLKKGTFKTTPNHATCFTCHSQESGVLPAPNDCAACHRLAPKPLPRSDFDPKVAATLNVTDPVLLQKWRRRTNGTFRHEWMMHAELGCNACHNVSAMNTLDEATKKVPILSCGGAGSGCHVTPTSDDGGALNLALDARKAKPDFQCAKCHLTLGKEPTPKSHLDAVEKLKQGGGS